MAQLQKITPFLWFDGRAEEAAEFYTSIFENSRILATTRYDETAAKASGQPQGAVVAMNFELAGQRFTALTGGPQFHFSPTVSFVVHRAMQAGIDHYWEKLGAGGDPAAQQCGWLADRFGPSWQIIPATLPELIGDPDPAKAG